MNDLESVLHDYTTGEKTLEEAEVSAAMKKILNGLESMGIELRQ